MSTLFEDVIGHEATKQELLALLEKNTIPHAILFVGPRGIGKKTLARAFASLILAAAERKNGDTALSDSLIRKGNHPDLHFAFREAGKKELTVETIRVICRSLQMNPYSGTAAVVLIDNAHEMNLPAANTLLKTLEEPPANVFLFLVTDAPQLLPETIISRCQQFNLSELTPQELLAVIKLRFSSLLSEAECEKLAQICETTLAPLPSEEFLDPKTFAVTNEESCKTSLREWMKTTEALDNKIALLLKERCAAPGFVGDATALASELSADKDALPAVWYSLRRVIRKNLRSSKASDCARFADTLLSALRAEDLTRERSLNPQLQLGQVLSLAQKEPCSKSISIKDSI